ncbi:MAG: hypothetical protein GTO63_12010 [Anaerolineae bacterium]|nr:hypothetical protein [Anaerolineae bacterium]NIN95619.1 hypothetical protein [Anaerolineae bacterium]NIQ78578.1 hypothetical protein [Anaerolineae bacterium]
MEDRIRELKARLPRHSTHPSMLMELEEPEEEVAQLRAQEISDETTDTGGLSPLTHEAAMLSSAKVGTGCLREEQLPSSSA